MNTAYDGVLSRICFRVAGLLGYPARLLERTITYENEKGRLWWTYCML